MHSVAGMLRPGVSLVRERPYRAPHHTASAVGLVGGGDPPRPGKARLLQVARTGDTNARLSVRALREVVEPDAAGQRLLTSAAERLGLSARAVHRVLKVARSVADLEGSVRVGAHHIAEAVAYRSPAGV